MNDRMNVHDPVQQTFGGWLRRQRRALDLTQEELARQVGCSAITLAVGVAIGSLLSGVARGAVRTGR